MTQHFVAFLLILGQALFLWAAGNSVWLPWIAVAASACAIMGMRVRLPDLLHHGLVLATACAVAISSRATFVPPNDSLAIFPLKLTHPLGDFFLIWQALLLLREGRQSNLPAYFPCLSLVTIFCAFDQSSKLEMLLFLVIALCFLLLAVTLFDRSSNNVFAAAHRERRSVGVSVLMSAAVAASVGVAAWTWFSNVIRVNVPAWRGEAAVINRSKPLYARNGDLGNITEEQRRAPLEVALNVVSPRQPGYLRGRVFDVYANSRWRLGMEPVRRRGMLSTRDMRLVDPDLNPPEDLPLASTKHKLFPLAPTNRRPLQRMAISNDPRRGVVYFTPLGANYIAGGGRQLVLDKEEVIHAGLNVSEPYTAFVTIPPEPEVLSAERERQLTDSMLGLSPRLTGLSKQVFQGKETFKDKIAAVEAYFRENYEYEAGAVTMPSGVEPLNHFLFQRPPAHCEYFASGAVAILRTHDIPARYVTGYVVTENEAGYDDRWVARNQHAHAWAEAYDRETQRWFVVEATPGMADVVDLPSEEEIAEIQQEEDGDWFAAAERGWSRIWRLYLSRYMTPIGISGIALGLVLIGFQRRRREMVTSYKRPESPELTRRRKAQLRLERSLARRGFARHSVETLHQFAARIAPPECPDPILVQAAEDCLDYARFRYRECAAEPPHASGSEAPDEA